MLMHSRLDCLRADAAKPTFALSGLYQEHDILLVRQLLERFGSQRQNKPCD